MHVATKFQWPAVACASLALGSCVFDPNARCDENMEVYGDGVKCVCVEGYALSEGGCVKCGAHETPSAEGCECDEGFERSSTGRCSKAADEDQGAPCETDGDCAGDTHDHCQGAASGEGYCTSTGCKNSSECKGGYACEKSESPTVCVRPPTGVGMECSSNSDCAGTDATYCETLMSHTCVVEGCSRNGDCFEGNECCDLTAFGLPTLCVPEGRCP